MQCPKTVKGDKRKQWQRLFGDRFKPANEVEVAMSVRFVEWLTSYESDRAYCDEHGTTVEGKNGVHYPDPHFTNMKTSEDQMRRLWEKLSKRIVEAKDDTADLGDFAGL